MPSLHPPSNSTVRVNDTAVSGFRLTVYGDRNTISGTGVTVHGDRNNVDGFQAVVYGNDNTVNGTGLTVVGNRNQVEGFQASATGDFNILTGTGATAHGNSNMVSGFQATAFGNSNTVDGASATATGDDNTVTGLNATVNGNNNTVTVPAVNGGQGLLVHHLLAAVAAPANHNPVAAAQDLFADQLPAAAMAPPANYNPGVAVNNNNIQLINFRGDEEETEDDSMTCRICFSHKKVVLSTCCGNLSTCIECARTLYTGKRVGEVHCMLCNQTVTHVVRVLGM